ncbi:amidohydrolase family protein [Clostridiaceae bacterium M8S5]|nr:amidohydrolase family protein [Clostridiaceae bacterium M8S5]
MRTLFINGDFITMTDKKIEWLLIKDSTIVNFGTKGQELPDHDKLVDLEGKTMMPGFINSHIHSLPTGMSTESIFVFECETKDELFYSIKEQLKDKSEGLVMVEGFNSSLMTFDPIEDLERFDEISEGRPMFIKYNTGHGGIVNTATMKILKKEDPFTMDEVEMGAAQNIFSDEKIKSFMAKLSDGCIANGVTLVHSLIYNDIDNRDIDWWLQEEFGERKLDVQVVNYVQTTDVDYVHKLGLPRIGGCVCLDGTPVEMTAALEEDYINKPGYRGDLYMSDEELYKMVSDAHSKNMQCAFHAVGDRAVHQLIDCYQRVVDEQGKKDLRHRIEHVDLISDEKLKQAKQLDLTFSVQPGLLYLFGANFGGILGEERNRKMSSLKLYREAGIMLLGGTDSPVTPNIPLIPIHGVVNSENELRKLSVEDALKMFTINGAYSVHLEDKKGSIEIGKDADLIVLDKNPVKNQTEIKDIKVVSTYVLGEEVYTEGR